MGDRLANALYSVGVHLKFGTARWGMTPMHMTGLGQHPYGSPGESLMVLELTSRMCLEDGESQTLKKPQVLPAAS